VERLPLVRLVSASLLVLSVAARPPATRVDADNAVRQALATAGDNAQLQAEALIRLAWPEGERDPAIVARARQELVGFGGNGIATLARSIYRVPARDRAEVVSTMIEARQFVAGPIPPEYVPGLENALWFGTRDAKLKTLDELALFRDPSAVLPLMDSAVEDEVLLPKVIETLGAIGDDRARFFLARLLNQGAPGIREAAAVALARISGRGLDPLKAAIRSQSRELRELAVRALLPAAGEGELGDLYDYLDAHPADDAALLTAVRGSAQQIEHLLELKRQADAADAPQDF
jgi:hypothetical protein